MKKYFLIVWKHFDDAITFVMFLGLFLTVLVQLVLRVVFNGGIVWTEELSRLFLMYACFASLPRVLKRGDELKLTMFVERLNRKQQLYFNIVVMVISIITFLFLVYWGFQTVKFQSTNIMPAMRFSMAWMYAAFPLSMIAGILRAGEMIVKDVKELKGGSEG